MNFRSAQSRNGFSGSSKQIGAVKKEIQHIEPDQDQIAFTLTPTMLTEKQVPQFRTVDPFMPSKSYSSF